MARAVGRSTTHRDTVMAERRLYTSPKTGRSCLILGSGQFVPEGVLQEMLVRMASGRSMADLRHRYGVTVEDLEFFLRAADSKP